MIKTGNIIVLFLNVYFTDTIYQLSSQPMEQSLWYNKRNGIARYQQEIYSKRRNDDVESAVMSKHVPSVPYSCYLTSDTADVKTLVQTCLF